MARSLRIAAVSVLALCASGAAEAQRLVMEYRGVAYGVLPFGRARIEVEIGPENYESSATLKTGGLAALFTRASLSAESTGAWGQAGAKPRRYSLDHFHAGRERVATVQWSKPKVAVEATPAFEPGDPAPTEEQRLAGRDPLATLLSMSAAARIAPCTGAFRVFDGLYVYDLTLSPAGEERMRWEGKEWLTVKCALRQQRIAGYSRPSDLAKSAPAGEIWFAIDADEPIAIPVRVASPLPLGMASIQLTRLVREGES